MRLSRKLIAYVIIFALLFTHISYKIYAVGGSGSNTNIAKVIDGDDGLQYLTFKVSSTSSTAKYKYKTIGWDITFIPHGEEPKISRITYDFKDHDGSDTVKLDLETKVFDKISESEEEKDRLKRKDGKLIADAIQIITINGMPMGTNGKAVNPSKIVGWESNLEILLNNSDVQKFTDEASHIIGGLPNGIQWSTATKENLLDYYNQKADYDKLYTEITVDLNLEVMSSIDEHTIDMSKGEGSAQVKIHAQADITGFKTNEYDMEAYLNNPSNIRKMEFTISDGTTKKTQTVTSFSALNGTTDFTFDYLPNHIEDGDSDLDDTVTKDYTCTVQVDYNRQCHGSTTKSTSTELIKKAPIPDGDPLAILSVPDQVLVDEEILADGSGSIAPKGATLVNYSWEVESEALPKEEGNKSITLTYDEPKTVTIALTVEDSNGKTDTAMKDVKVIKKASPPVNWSPDVSLSGPTIVMQGDSFSLHVNATDQEDGPLTPTLSKPSSLVLSSAVQNGDNTAKFVQSGIFTITAKATDSGGKSDSASIQIEVCPPKPLAIISEDGDYKVGQTVVLDSSNSKAVSKTYPIDWTLTNWTITPLGSLTSDDIYTKKLNDKEIAFTSKKSGKVEIALTVTNTLGNSNTRTIERTILADTPPIADFTLIEKVYRDKDNDKKAIVRAFDTSSSPDGDSITKRAWFYAFDSDNDGIFSDDTWYYHNGTNWVDSNTNYGNLFTFADTVDTGNLTDVTVETTHVGRYKFELKVYEEHDNRLLEFVDTSYILTDDTADKPGEECIAEVDNIAPVTAVKVDVSKDEAYDIVVVTDYKDMDLISLQTELNLLKAKAFANNKDFNIHMVTDTIKTGKQHKIRNYYTFARNVNLRYYLNSGYYQFSSSSHHRTEEYNHDLRTPTIHYETTQSYTYPTVPFAKGDKFDWQQTSFSTSYNGTYGGYNKSGVEFQFYNPDNKIATLATYRVTTNGSEQGMGWCQVWQSISVGDVSVSVNNYWTQTTSYTPHDFYYDIYGMDFSKVKDVNYINDSKKIFLYFTKGTAYNYENTTNNYSATSLDKDLLDYLVYNDFETYVITPNESTLNIKFDNDDYGSDISTQYATLRELAHCSPTRGKYIIGDVYGEQWKDQLMHITQKNVVMPHDVHVENNVIHLTFDEAFKDGEEIDLKLLLEQTKLSDLVGNTVDLSKIEFDTVAKVNDSDIKGLSSLCFSNPMTQRQLVEDVNIIKAVDNIILYQQDGKYQLHFVDDERAKNTFSAQDLATLKILNFADVKDIQIQPTFIAVLYANGSVKSFGNVYSSLKINDSQWTNITKLLSVNTFIVGIKNNGKIIMTGYYPYRYGGGRSYSNMEESFQCKDSVITSSGIMLMDNNLDYRQFGYTYNNFYPKAITDKYYYMTNFEMIGSTLSPCVYIKYGGKYYRFKNYNEPMELIQEIKDMAIKEFIPVGYNEFIVVKQDDTLYYSESYKTRLQNGYHYADIWSKANNIGKIKKIIPVEDTLWVKGEHNEFYISYNSSSPSRIPIGKKTFGYRYIPIKDVQEVVSHDGNGSRYNTDTIIFMKNGDSYYLTDQLNAHRLGTNTKYFFADDHGVSYMTKTGFFYSSVVERYKYNYPHRNFSGSFDKVISGYLDSYLIGLRNGTVSVYQRYSGNNHLSNAAYYNDVEDIFMYGYVLFLVRKNGGITALYENNMYEQFYGYNSFYDKSIQKYIIHTHLYGLDPEGRLWRTDKSGLINIASNVQDFFLLDNEIIYLTRDGSLSQYGDGNKFETYDNMLVAPHFITLKFKGTDELVCITKDGIDIGYIGGFDKQAQYIQYLRSTQFHIGQHQPNGVAYRYKIFTDQEESVEEVLLHQTIDDTWIDVKDKDIIPVQDGYYIGVVEIDAENKAIGYSYMKAVAENM